MTYKELLKKHEDETNQMVKDGKILYFIGDTEKIKQDMEDKGIQQDQLVYIGAGAYVKKECADEVNGMFDRHAEEQRQIVSLTSESYGSSHDKTTSDGKQASMQRSHGQTTFQNALCRLLQWKWRQTSQQRHQQTTGYISGKHQHKKR